MRSWRGTEALAGLVVVAAAALCVSWAAAAAQKGQKSESTLAGLRPGRDRLKTAANVHGPYYRKVSPDSERELVWIDTAKRRALRVEVDDKGVIRSVVVSTIDPLISNNEGGADSPLPSRSIATGRGLRIGYDSFGDVKETYGEPDATAEELRHGLKVEAAHYVYDKAPEQLDFYCERGGGRILEIRLAAPPK